MRATAAEKSRARRRAVDLRTCGHVEAEQRVEPHGDALRRPQPTSTSCRDARRRRPPKPSSRPASAPPASRSTTSRTLVRPGRRRRGARRPTAAICMPERVRRRWSPSTRRATSEGCAAAPSAAPAPRTRSACAMAERRTADGDVERPNGAAIAAGGGQARRAAREHGGRFSPHGPRRRRGTWTRDSPTGSRSPIGFDVGPARRLFDAEMEGEPVDGRRRPLTRPVRREVAVDRVRRHVRDATARRRSPWHDATIALSASGIWPSRTRTSVMRTPVVFAGCVNQSRSADALARRTRQLIGFPAPPRRGLDGGRQPPRTSAAASPELRSIRVLTTRVRQQRCKRASATSRRGMRKFGVVRTTSLILCDASRMVVDMVLMNREFDRPCRRQRAITSPLPCELQRRRARALPRRCAAAPRGRRWRRARWQRRRRVRRNRRAAVAPIPICRLRLAIALAGDGGAAASAAPLGRGDPVRLKPRCAILEAKFSSPAGDGERAALPAAALPRRRDAVRRARPVGAAACACAARRAAVRRAGALVDQPPALARRLLRAVRLALRRRADGGGARGRAALRAGRRVAGVVHVHDGGGARPHYLYLDAFATIARRRCRNRSAARRPFAAKCADRAYGMEHCYPEAARGGGTRDFNVPSFVATVLEGAQGRRPRRAAARAGGAAVDLVLVLRPVPRRSV